MAQIVENVNKAAGVAAVYSVPVGKRVYGFLNINAIDIDLTVDGVTAKLLNNTGVRQYMLPVPLEFKASTSISFSGSSAATIGVIVDE